MENQDPLQKSDIVSKVKDWAKRSKLVGLIILLFLVIEFLAGGCEKINHLISGIRTTWMQFPSKRSDSIVEDKKITIPKSSIYIDHSKVSGDVIVGDKVLGDKIGRDKVENLIQNNYHAPNNPYHVPKPELVMNTDPFYQKMDSDYYRIAYDIKNIGDGKAYNLRQQIVSLVEVQKDHLIVSKDIEKETNESVSIPPGGAYSYYTGKNTFTNPNVIIFIKISYTGNQIPGKTEKHYLRRIYRLPNARMGPEIFDIDSTDYSYIKANLIDLKKW